MTNLNIPREDWEWDGYPKHYIRAHYCLFSMSTKVGNLAVCTIGDCRRNYPDGSMEAIGRDRNFETKVFEAVKADCNCCEWSVDVSEEFQVLSGSYQTAKEAREGHISICKLVANKQEE